MSLDDRIEQAELAFAFATGKRDSALKDYQRKELELQQLRLRRTQKQREEARNG